MAANNNRRAIGNRPLPDVEGPRIATDQNCPHPYPQAAVQAGSRQDTSTVMASRSKTIALQFRLRDAGTWERMLSKTGCASSASAATGFSRNHPESAAVGVLCRHMVRAFHSRLTRSESRVSRVFDPAPDGPGLPQRKQAAGDDCRLMDPAGRVSRGPDRAASRHRLAARHPA